MKARLLAYGIAAGLVGLFSYLAQPVANTVPIKRLVASREKAKPVVEAVTVGLTEPMDQESTVDHITSNTIISSSSVNHITSNAIISSSSVNHITSNTVISSSSVNHITSNTVISSSSVQHLTSNALISSALEFFTYLMPQPMELPQPQISTNLMDQEI